MEAFLDYWERERKSSSRTRNHRLAALHAFFRYVQAEEPERMLQCQKILAIPQGKHARPRVAYLSKEELAEILAQPDLRTAAGRRDAVLLSILYDTGARVQELIDLSVGDVRLDPPEQLRLLGKGRKMRAVPLMKNTVQLLRDHIQENHLDRPQQFDKPLFQNARNEPLSRSGIRYILQKYLVRARSKRPSLNRTVSPRTLRHTKGMHLLQSGISLDMIRDFLGHVDVKTTQIYARANLERNETRLRKSASLHQSERFQPGSRTRIFLIGSVLCTLRKDVRACQVATELRHRARYYVESTNTCRLAITKLAQLTAHIYCLHIIDHCRRYVLIPK